MNVLVLTIGFALDMLLGDPPSLPHVVVAMGKAISLLERALRRLFPATPRGELAGGAVLVVIMLVLSFGVPRLVFDAAERVHPMLRFFLECFACWQVLAAKCLADAGGRVWGALAFGGLDAARTAVGMIVGRDTATLDAAGVTRAAVETVAENTSDGVVAPMFFFALGGAPLALAYKAVNTMDSMLGYRNERHLYFGRAAARLDDAANLIPARLTALLMILYAASAHAQPATRFDWRGALRICRRDGRAHSSPNSGWPEAACAGALGIRLGGDSAYGGCLVRKPGIGDALREIEPDDILRANQLMYGCATIAYLLSSMYLIVAGTGGTPPWHR